MQLHGLFLRPLPIETFRMAPALPLQLSHGDYSLVERCRTPAPPSVWESAHKLKSEGAIPGSFLPASGWRAAAPMNLYRAGLVFRALNPLPSDRPMTAGHSEAKFGMSISAVSVLRREKSRGSFVSSLQNGGKNAILPPPYCLSRRALAGMSAARDTESLDHREVGGVSH